MSMSVYGYSAYGETQLLGVDGYVPVNSNQYTARENDGLVGGTNGGAIYYYRTRYYDPVLKRFVSEDPLGTAGGFNVYEYALSNPLSYVDHDGELPSLPQGVVDFSAGLGDALLFGFGDDLRLLLGTNGGVDRCSSAYSAGELASFALGVGRLAYAGTAKAISLIPRLTGVHATSARNALKVIFRGGFFPNYGRRSYADLLKDYGGDAAVKAAAGRTSKKFNAAGAHLTGGAVVNAIDCNCQ